MTASKDLKKLIRLRMRKTGESYTAARRSFLHSQEINMTLSDQRRNPAVFRLPLDHLSLTLKTARMLKTHQVENVGQLIGKTDSELAGFGLGSKERVEVRDVLASRGL